MTLYCWYFIDVHNYRKCDAKDFKAQLAVKNTPTLIPTAEDEDEGLIIDGTNVSFTATKVHKGTILWLHKSRIQSIS